MSNYLKNKLWVLNRHERFKGVRYTKEEQNPLKLEKCIKSNAVAYKIYGNSIQKRNGKNLFNINDFQGVDGVEIDDNSITIANKTHVSCSGVGILNRLKPNTKYYCSFGEQSILAGEQTTTTYRIALLPDIGSPIYLKYTGSGSFTTPNDLSQFKHLTIYCGANTTIKISDIQVEEGSTKTSYEPYQAMSTPELPSEVESTGDRTKNLIDLGKFGSSTTRYGLKVDVDADNQTVTLNGSVNITSGVSLIRPLINIPIKRNTYYTLSVKYVSGSIIDNGGKYNVFYIGGCTNENKASTNWMAKQLYNEGSVSKLNTEFDFVKDMWIYLNNGGVENGWVFDNYTFKIQFEESNVATEWEPYGYKTPIKTIGRNLFNKKSIPMAKDSYTYSKETDTGIKLAIDTSALTGTEYYLYNRFPVNINLKKYIGKTLSVKFTAYVKNDYQKGKISLYVWDGVDQNNRIGVASTQEISSTIAKEYSVKFTITNERANFGFLYFNAYLTSGTRISAGDYIVYDNLTVVVDNEDLSYEPYNEKEIVIYTKEPLRKNEEYADYYDYELQKVIRRIKRYYITGNENYVRTWDSNIYSMTLNEKVIKNTDIALFNGAFSNKYPAVIYSTSPSSLYINRDNILYPYLIAVRYYDETNKVSIKDDRFTDVNLFKVWLREQYDAGTPVYVDYILDTPIEEDLLLPAISLEDNTNNILVDTSIDPSKLSITYNKNIDELRTKIRNKIPLSGDDFKCLSLLNEQGLTREVLSIGSQIVTTHNKYGDLVWDIIGINHDIPVGNENAHSITLQLHDCLPVNIAFDSTEATWYIDAESYPNGLAPGTYYFTLPADYDSNYGGGKTYNFTTTKTVPIGGQIRFNWQNNTDALNCNILIYQDSKTTTILETLSVIEGQVGIAMPTINTTIATANSNCVHRMRYGSNNWSKSAIRQWINSSDIANEWWKPSNVFDRPSINVGIDGFLNGIDKDFLNILGDVIKTTQNSISDGYGLQTSNERFFLLSRAETYGGIERSVDGADGIPYQFYKKGYSDLTAPGIGEDNNRIKLGNNTAIYWLLRTSTSDNGCIIRRISAVGGFGATYTSTRDNGIAPACVICTNGDYQLVDSDEEITSIE